MLWNLTDVYPAALPALLLVGARPVRSESRLHTCNSDYLSLDTGTCLRGLFAVVVILHHLSLRLQVGALFPQLFYIGHLPVAVFFFLSGYGLMKSYRTKEHYETHFLPRRALKLLLPYACTAVLYWTFCIVRAHAYTFRDALRVTLGDNLIIPYTWFIFCILLFYIVFWLLMRLCKTRHALMLVGAAVWCMIYTVVCIRLQFGVWRYKTVLMLVVGMAWALYEDKLLTLFRRRYAVLAPLTVALFVLLFGLYMQDVFGTNSAPWRSLPAALFSAMFFVFSVLMFTLKWRIGNPALRFLGKNSPEIYLVQGLFIDGLRSELIYIRSGFLWVLLTLVGSIALGSALHALTSAISEKIKR